MTIKAGYIECRSQQEINKSRREKTNNAYKKLQREVQILLNENHQIIQKTMD